MRQSEFMEYLNASVVHQEAGDVYHSNLRKMCVEWLLLTSLVFILLLIGINFEMPVTSAVCILNLAVCAFALNELSTVKNP